MSCGPTALLLPVQQSVRNDVAQRGGRARRPNGRARRPPQDSRRLVQCTAPRLPRRASIITPRVASG
eukprot:4600935-Prymnesium_polylepis.1